MPLSRAGRNHIAQDTIAPLGTGPVPFDNINGHIGIGTSTTPFDQTHTDLVVPAMRKEMEPGFPVMFGGNVVIARILLLGGEGNVLIREWGWFNAAIGGTMMSRKQEQVGALAKPSGQVWMITASLIFANA